MKKKMMYLSVGLVAGALISYTAPTYAAVKQYILKEFSSPVVVNGKVYKDANNPILEYKGKAYLPLAKIGDLTGVPYKWNAEKKRVEIGTFVSSSTNGVDISKQDLKIMRDIAEDKSIDNFVSLTPTAEVVKTYLEKENGITVLYLEDQDGRKHRLTDADNTDYVLAERRKETLPPSISEGWLSEELFKKVYGPDEYIAFLPFGIQTREFKGVDYYDIDTLINSLKDIDFEN